MDALLDRLLIAAANRHLVICDLDDTLIDEQSYLFAGYDAIARSAGQPAAAPWMKNYFISHGRHQLFSSVRLAFPDMSGSDKDWLAALRSVSVPLHVLPWVEPFCSALPNLPLAILTNGNQLQQLNKFQQLVPASIRSRFTLCCAADFLPKPSPAGLLHLLASHLCHPHDALMIGDSDSDAACAAAASVPFFLMPPPSRSAFPSTIPS